MDGRVFEIDSRADFWEVPEYPPIDVHPYDTPMQPVEYGRHTYKIRSHGNDHYDAIWVKPRGDTVVQ